MLLCEGIKRLFTNGWPLYSSFHEKGKRYGEANTTITLRRGKDKYIYSFTQKSIKNDIKTQKNHVQM